MSGDGKDQRPEPQRDADAEPPKKERLTHAQHVAALKANPRFVRAQPSGEGFIFMVNGPVPPKKPEG
jgi:hypothetical protein